jgi:hypothetical protein
VRARVVPGWLLACALVLSQAIALLHGITHMPRLIGDAPVAHRLAHDASSHWTAALFAGHDDASTCRLFDSLSHTAPPACADLAVPAAIPPYLLPLWAGEALARWAALFDARGPPSPVR